MATDARQFIAGIVSPNGTHLALADLPKSRRVHWTPRLKADVVRAVHGGLLSFDEARERYALSREEFRTWEVGCGALAPYGLLDGTARGGEHSKRTESVPLN
jgi:uncharacterized protein DUF1153